MQSLSGTTVHNKEKNKLEKIQTEAAKIGTGMTKIISLSNIYKEIYCGNTSAKATKLKACFILQKGQ